MNDRQLLELAAKAAGIEIYEATDAGIKLRGVLGLWNPLTNDGDALRLAHKLGLLSDVEVWPRTIEETRRAIVRAAAQNAVLDWNNGETWNQLTNDGDDLRHTVKLHLEGRFTKPRNR